MWQPFTTALPLMPKQVPNVLLSASFYNNYEKVFNIFQNIREVIIEEALPFVSM